MRDKDKPWFDEGMLFASSRRLIFGGPSDRSRVNWEEFVRCQVRANETYSEGKRQFSDRNCDVLWNHQSPHKWWSTLKGWITKKKILFTREKNVINIK